MNDVIISVVFPKSEDSPVKDITRWADKFDDKLVIEAIDYDGDWSPETSRVEFKGIYKEES